MPHAPVRPVRGLIPGLLLALALCSCAARQAPGPESLSPVPNADGLGATVSVPAGWTRLEPAAAAACMEPLLRKMRADGRFVRGVFTPPGGACLPLLAVMSARDSGDIQWLDFVLAGMDVSGGSVRQESVRREEQGHFRLKVRETASGTAVLVHAFFRDGSVTVLCFALPSGQETRYEPVADRIAGALRTDLARLDPDLGG